MKGEPLHRLALVHSLAGRSFAEVWLALKVAVVEAKLPLGQVVEKVRTTSVGQAASKFHPDVLPVPLFITMLLTLLKCCTFLSDVPQGFVKIS